MRLIRFLLLLINFCVNAQSPQDSQVHAIATQLRCPTCEAQSVADSQAPIAKQMRQQISQAVLQNKSEQTILTEMAVRYGDQVLLDPPLSVATFALWFLPLLGVCLLGWLGFVRFRFQVRK